MAVDPCIDFEVIGVLSSGDGGIRTFDIGGVLFVTPEITTTPVVDAPAPDSIAN